MGEQQLDVVSSDELCFVPRAQFERLLNAGLSAEDEAHVFAALCRINTFYMIAQAWSGHLGTSFSSLDIMSWVFLHELRDLDRGPESCDIFFSSKGHDAPALYAVLIGLGLMPEARLHQLRRLHGLPGHPHVETPFIQANTGSLGMGVSKAKGMVLADRLLGRSRRVVVLAGDGELQEGQFWESLPTAVHHRMEELVVIVDHNKMQSDTWVSDVSDLGDLERKFSAFGWHVARVDGHDPAALAATFRILESVRDQPKAIIADTVKGKGVSFMEGPATPHGQLYMFHSGAPNEEQYAQGSTELVERARASLLRHGLGPLMLESRSRTPRKPVLSVQRLVAAYSSALVEQAERNPRVIALDADLVKDCGLLEFRDRFPDRFVECGIAEQDMVSVACGMAHRGALPVVHSFACFLAARPNEQIYNQASESSRVVYVGSLAGLLPGGPGHSHQSVRDISALGAVPGLVAAEPCTEREVGLLVDYMFNRASGSSYLRLVSLGWPVPFSLPDDYQPSPGRGVTVRSGGDAVVIGYGPWLLSNAYEAAERLAAHGVQLRVVNLPWLNCVDQDWLRDTISGVRQVIALDNHYTHGGQGQTIASAVASMGLDPAVRVSRIGVTSLPECGTNEEVLAHHQLDVEGLFKQFAACLGLRVDG